MFDNLISGTLASIIASSAKTEEVTEIRMRTGRAVVIQTLNNRFCLKENGVKYIASKSDIDRVLSVASNFSVYTVGDEMKKGYIPYGKYRIGVAGEGVLENGMLLNVKNISSVVIRIPHQVKNAADDIADEVLGVPLSTLVISPPSAGKTTMLRELARLASNRFNTVIIDERYELAASASGNPCLDVGEADVVSGVPKVIAYENCVRALSPEIIVTDEVFKEAEIEAICDIVRSGVKVFASLHGKDIDSLICNKRFEPLFCAFDFAVVLSKTQRAGTIVETRRLHG